eukprot:EG_transcript_7491
MAPAPPPRLQRGWWRWAVVLGAVLLALMCPNLLKAAEVSWLWCTRLASPHATALRVPVFVGRTPRQAVQPPPLLWPHISHSGGQDRELEDRDRIFVVVTDPPAPPHKKPPPFPVLAGLAALFSAAVANNVVQLQAAVQSVRSVFAGGADSLLHHLPVGSVLSEQQELLVNFLAGFVACSVSVSLTYPMDTLKTRLQAKGYQPGKTRFRDLYRGLVPALLTSCPSASLFIALSYLVKRLLLAVPLLAASGPVATSLVSGAICNALLSLYRVPSDMMVKLLQTDVCRTVPQAVHRIFCSPGALRILFTVWTIILVKAIPTGALKIAVYEAYDLLFSAPFAAWGMSKFAKSMFCGACSGVTTGLLTTPIDVVMTRIMTEVHDNPALRDPAQAPPGRPALNGLALVRQTSAEVYAEHGIGGFFTGALLRASYYAPSSCSFFAVFETLKVVLTRAMLGL